MYYLILMQLTYNRLAFFCLFPALNYEKSVLSKSENPIKFSSTSIRLSPVLDSRKEKIHISLSSRIMENKTFFWNKSKSTLNSPFLKKHFGRHSNISILQTERMKYSLHSVKISSFILRLLSGSLLHAIYALKHKKQFSVP